MPSNTGDPVQPKINIIRAQSDITKLKETEFLDAFKINEQIVKNIKNISFDLIDFGSITNGFKCTKLNNQYDYMKDSFCYISNTMFLYSVLFFIVSIIGIPMLISSVNLTLSLNKNLDKVLPFEKRKLKIKF